MIAGLEGIRAGCCVGRSVRGKWRKIGRVAPGGRRVAAVQMKKDGEGMVRDGELLVEA